MRCRWVGGGTRPHNGTTTMSTPKCRSVCCVTAMQQLLSSLRCVFRLRSRTISRLARSSPKSQHRLWCVSLLAARCSLHCSHLHHASRNAPLANRRVMRLGRRSGCSSSCRRRRKSWKRCSMRISKAPVWRLSSKPKSPRRWHRSPRKLPLVRAQRVQLSPGLIHARWCAVAVPARFGPRRVRDIAFSPARSQVRAS